MLSQYGCDGILVVTPYYNKCTQEGLYLHYKEIAKHVSLPIIVYNVPSRTGVDIHIDTLAKLANIKNIWGIKEASGDISKISQIIARMPSHFCVYSGNDDQTFAIMALGGSGVISVSANIFPKQIHDMCQYMLEEDWYNARKLHTRYLTLSQNLFLEVNPIPIKEAMNMMEFNVGPCRLPLSPMNTEKAAQLKRSLLEVTI